MSKDRSELVNKILEILRIKETGQTAEVEDYNIVDEDVDGLIDELSVRELCAEVDIEEIDDVLFRPIAILGANRVGFEFGVPPDPQQISEAEKKLRQISEANIYDKTMEGEYY